MRHPGEVLKNTMWGREGPIAGHCSGEVPCGGEWPTHSEEVLYDLEFEVIFHPGLLSLSFALEVE